jgi:WD40 repeat protein
MRTIKLLFRRAFTSPLLIFAVLVGTTASCAYHTWWPEPDGPTKTVFTAPWKEVPPALCLAFSPDGSVLVATRPKFDPFNYGARFTWGQGYACWVIAMRSGNSQLLVPPSETQGKCCFSPTGDRFVIYSDHFVKLFETRTGKMIGDFMSKVDNPLVGACFSVEGHLLVISYREGDTIVREVGSTKPSLRLAAGRWHRPTVFEHYFYISSEDGEYGEVWDIRTGAVVTTYAVGDFRTVTAIQDGICFLYQDHIVFFDFETRQKRFVPVGTTTSVPQLPLGKRCVPFRVREDEPSPIIGNGRPTRAQFPGIVICDVGTNEARGYLSDALRLTASRDGTKLAMAKGQNQIELWQLPARMHPLWVGFIGGATAIAVLSIAKRAKSLRQLRCLPSRNACHFSWINR